MATLVFLFFTTVFSIIGFFSPGFIEKYYLSPFRIKHYKEHYRFLSHAFVHAGFLHLGFNLLALYSFGLMLEEFYFPQLYGEKWGRVMYLLLFTGGIYASSFLEYFMYRNNKSYASLGISGSVSAIVFAFILINPMTEIGFFFIPMKGWVAGLMVLGVSMYLIYRKRKGNYSDPISHESHYCGALFGIVFMLVTKPELGKEFIKTLAALFT